MTPTKDPRFVIDDQFKKTDAGPSSAKSINSKTEIIDREEAEEGSSTGSEGEGFGTEEEEGSVNNIDIDEGIESDASASPTKLKGSKVAKTLTPEALAAFREAQERTGVIYISRIPPAMRPTKVRHLMSQYGEVGRVYLQQEDPKSAYLRRKHTSTKKAHYTEGWVEFMDKRVARSVATMLNAQPIGGKKGTRWRDDVWTMKYLPKFKWNMLTEQIANEAAQHTAKLRVEIEQSRREQKDYLRQVELARVLDKRAKRKREAAEQRGEKVDESNLLPPLKRRMKEDSETSTRKKRPKEREESNDTLNSVLKNIF